MLAMYCTDITASKNALAVLVDEKCADTAITRRAATHIVFFDSTLRQLSKHSVGFWTPETRLISGIQTTNDTTNTTNTDTTNTTRDVFILSDKGRIVIYSAFNLIYSGVFHTNDLIEVLQFVNNLLICKTRGGSYLIIYKLDWNFNFTRILNDEPYVRLECIDYVKMENDILNITRKHSIEKYNFTVVNNKWSKELISRIHNDDSDSDDDSFGDLGYYSFVYDLNDFVKNKTACVVLNDVTICLTHDCLYIKLVSPIIKK